VQRALDFSKQGKIKMILNSQVSGISKNENKITLDVQSKDNDLSKINCDGYSRKIIMFSQLIFNIPFVRVFYILR